MTKVTGASGYIGYEIVSQLLKAGYRVRGTARNDKVRRLQSAFNNSPSFEVVDVPDIVEGDLETYLEGVDAVIHTAAPLMGKSEAEGAFRTAMEGSLHVLEEGYRLGIKRFVVTGSVASFGDDGPFGDDDWNDKTKEEALETKDPRTIYLVQKKLGEQVVRSFANSHPDARIGIINPPFVYGPLSPGFHHVVGPEWKDQIRAGNRPISTAGHFYALIDKEDSNVNLLAIQGSPYIDVRDLARAHIELLHGGTVTPLGAPRLLVVSPHLPKIGEALEIIRTEKPELCDRLVSVEHSRPSGGKQKQSWPGLPADEGLKRIEEVIGIRREEYRSYRETVLDTVDSLIELEGLWQN
ncbi:NAD(P)-binding protein [Dendrothele bispora CBS 962.96]|uniref:NAD(P)-binding protein n=1 Tax=Dendrothele bispora (strain CBS 962.96) TaxID=1314807 RepID=A0A4S8LLX7_DENBC|nr:NAD(P)-binding protein [Dendrothele bispora CBS 962.96]